LQEFGASFRDRLEALARVNGLLSRLNEGDRITFSELIRTELSGLGITEALGHPGQVTLHGPENVRLRSSTVQTLALGLHELATNALKYGALSRPEGRLSIRWSLKRPATGDRRLQVEWREDGIPVQLGPDEEPVRKGYGRELIERALPYQLQAETSYAITREGVHCIISLPLSNIPEDVAHA
jgi:two-component sensor histidine kinase